MVCEMSEALHHMLDNGVRVVIVHVVEDVGCAIMYEVEEDQINY